jgi:hypothetical protein
LLFLVFDELEFLHPQLLDRVCFVLVVDTLLLLDLLYLLTVLEGDLPDLRPLRLLLLEDQELGLLEETE